MPGSGDGTPPAPAATVELTAGEAAFLLGCSTEYARRLARTGRVLARRAGPAWLINRQALDTYRKGQPCPTPSPPPESKPTTR
ncbi:helix-turn-helix domain-containing protein [Streptomyces clavifer]|uniref:helix-turn-helix domain-containing protein n=1 Tax=Streptomyces clavifer TaxID=68188 RepID=UPI00364AC1AF